MSTARLRAKLAAPRTASDQTEEEKMKGKKGADGKEEDNEASDNDEDDGEGVTPPKKDGKKAAVVAPVDKAAASPERARMKSITTGAGAKMFPALAAHLAYDTDLSSDQAAAVFEAVMQDVETEAAAPTPAKEASASPKGAAFRKAMEAEAPNPPLGSGGGKTAEPEDPWLAAAKNMGVA